VQRSWKLFFATFPFCFPGLYRHQNRYLQWLMQNFCRTSWWAPRHQTSAPLAAWCCCTRNFWSNKMHVVRVMSNKGTIIKRTHRLYSVLLLRDLILRSAWWFEDGGRVTGEQNTQEEHLHLCIPPPTQLKSPRNPTPPEVVFLITFRHTAVGQDSSGRGIGPSQKPLSDNTQHSHPCQSQKASGRRPSPQIARPLGSATYI
jgi:hypothetical protein